MRAEVEQLRERVEELEGAIREVVTQQGDELCWLDVLRDLAKLVGLEFDPKLLPRDTFERNCRRFADHIYTGVPYATQDAGVAEAPPSESRPVSGRSEVGS